MPRIPHRKTTPKERLKVWSGIWHARLKKIIFPRVAGCVQIAYFAFARCVAWNHCHFYIAHVFLNVCSWRPRALTRAPRSHGLLVLPTARVAREKNIINGYFKRGDSGFCFCNSVATIVTVRCLGLINSFCFVSARHAPLLDTTSVVFHFKIGICGALMSLMYQTAIKIRVVFNCRALICFLGSVVSSCVILL